MQTSGRVFSDSSVLELIGGARERTSVIINLGGSAIFTLQTVVQAPLDVFHPPSRFPALEAN